jgi:hypothetical protein
MSDVRLTILSRSCGACPFKGEFANGVPGAGLRPGRLKAIIEETTSGNGAYFSCHKTVEYGDDEDGVAGSDAVFGSAAVCSGWLEAVEKLGKVPQVIQIAERLGFIERVEPPAESADVG